MKFRGEANVRWTETKSRTRARARNNNRGENHSVSYYAREEYFKNKFFLVGAKGKNVEMIYLIIIFITYHFITYTRGSEPFIWYRYQISTPAKEGGAKGPLLTPGIFDFVHFDINIAITIIRL